MSLPEEGGGQTQQRIEKTGSKSSFLIPCPFSTAIYPKVELQQFRYEGTPSLLLVSTTVIGEDTDHIIGSNVLGINQRS